MSEEKEEIVVQENATENGNWKSDDFVAFSLDDDEESDTDERPPLEEQQLQVSGEVLPPWMTSPPRQGPRRVNPLVALHNEIVDFYRLMEPLPQEVREREELVELFTRVAHKAFGKDKCQVQVFGSQATGLFLPTSDIDLVIILNEDDKDKKGSKDGKNNKDVKKAPEEDKDEWQPSLASGSPLEQLARTLRDEWHSDLTYLEIIENTRVPLVKFTHSSGISCDVCFDQETGPKAALLMKTYMEAMPPLRPLAFVLKYFMESRGLNEPYRGGVGSYMLQLMIVSFLQHRERDGYNFRRPSLYNLGCLLLEFFELYGLDFNYVTTGISVRHDGYYFPKGAKDRIDHFWQPSRRFSMAIENPLEPTHDVGKTSFRIGVVQRSFELAFKTLLAHVTEPMVPAVSALASILPPTKEMKHRALTKRTARPSKAAARRQTSASSNMEMSSDEDSDERPAKRRKRY